MLVLAGAVRGSRGPRRLVEELYGPVPAREVRRRDRAPAPPAAHEARA